jgi:hypothetical protein
MGQRPAANTTMLVKDRISERPGEKTIIEVAV